MSLNFDYVGWLERTLFLLYGLSVQSSCLNMNKSKSVVVDSNIQVAILSIISCHNLNKSYHFCVIWKCHLRPSLLQIHLCHFLLSTTFFYITKLTTLFCPIKLPTFKFWVLLTKTIFIIIFVNISTK